MRLESKWRRCFKDLPSLIACGYWNVCLHWLHLTDDWQHEGTWMSYWKYHSLRHCVGLDSMITMSSLIESICSTFNLWNQQSFQHFQNFHTFRKSSKMFKHLRPKSWVYLCHFCGTCWKVQSEVSPRYTKDLHPSSFSVHRSCELCSLIFFEVCFCFMFFFEFEW